MRDGTWDGHSLESPELRRLFTREHLLESAWYAARLDAQKQQDEQLAARQVDALAKFLMRPQYSDEATRLGIPDRLDRARRRLNAARDPGYPQMLIGTLGRQPSFVPSEKTSSP